MADLDALVRFAQVVEFGSFSAAARRLGVSRQAVQRSVDALEKAHGVVLLERNSRRLRLTDAGRRVLVAARRVREAGLEADALLEASTESPRGVLRISAPPLFANAVLTRVITSFLTDWPEVRVRGYFMATRADPERDDIDVTLRVGAPPPETSYAVRLGSAGLGLVATPAYLAAHAAPDHPDRLTAHRTLDYGRDAGPWRFDGPEGPVEVRVDPHLRADSAPVVLAACLADGGILRIPWMVAGDRVRAGEVVPVLEDFRIPAADVWAIYGHRTAGDPTLAAFLDALKRTTWGPDPER